jgi:predicted glutamine amidotransferase
MRKDGRQAIKQIIKTYEKQKSRGQQGFGYVAFTKGEIEDVSRNATEVGIYKSLKTLESEGVMFHHRIPTSTPNFKEGAHPIHVSNPRLKFDYYVIHNGVITNDDFLKEKHEKLGYVYTTEMLKQERWTTRDEEYVEDTAITKFNDSEALAIELAEGIESNATKIEAYGSIAFICIQADKDDGNNVIKIHNIFYGRNTNPLMIENNNNYLKLSSEGGREDVKAHILFQLNLATGITTERPCDFGSNITAYEYAHKGEHFVHGEYKNGEWTEGHWEKDSPNQKLPVIYDRGDDWDDWTPRKSSKQAEAILERAKLEKELEAEIEGIRETNLDDPYEPVLTGEETKAELENIKRNAENAIADYDAKGMVEQSNEIWIILEEVEEALNAIKLDEALDKVDGVQNPPRYISHE